MSDPKTWVIQTDDLEIGTTLSFDLTDAEGNVLHKAGIPINERIKERLQKKNIHSVIVRGESNSEFVPPATIILGAFQEETTRAVQASIDATQKSVSEFVNSFQTHEAASSEAICINVNTFIKQASQNVAATLAVFSLSAQIVDDEILQKLTKQATRASLLGVIVSVAKKDPLRTSFEIGMAGLLHDCSMMMHPEWFRPEPNQRTETFLEDYRRHPIESAELLNGISGIPNDSITMITQVHEQADGTGYPRGLKLAQTLPGASILNIIDAYLAMTEPLMGTPITEADVMAYLCQQAANGKFCRESLHSLLQCLSIYPVGSSVILDDESKAVVIQSNAGHPMQPIVKLMQSGFLRIDLSESNRFIASPYLSGGSSQVERIPKSRMQEVLWRTDH